MQNTHATAEEKIAFIPVHFSSCVHGDLEGAVPLLPLIIPLTPLIYSGTGSVKPSSSRFWHALRSLLPS
jgi:hypothetical protein